jgi:hypothetical protein
MNSVFSSYNVTLRGALKKYRDERRGALKRFSSLKKTVVLKMYHKTRNNNVYIFINGCQISSLLCSCKLVRHTGKGSTVGFARDVLDTVLPDTG